jgi:hypothetical protein
MNRKLILTLLVIIIGANAFGQVLKYRVGGNYSKFNKETGAEEIEHPLVPVLSNPNSTDFTHAFEPGFEAELMMLWSPNFETGLEFERIGFSGRNDIPPYYNYYFAPDNPTVITTTQPLSYASSAMNFKLNFRFYLAPEGIINPFIKAFGGLSKVAAELSYADPNFEPANNVKILYALGTENSDKSRESAFIYGAGLGINFKLSEKIFLYVDGTASTINSDKVDGIPNYDYTQNNGQATLKPVGNQSLITQFSAGLVFKSNTDLGLIKSGSGNKKKSSGIKRSGRTTPWRPFYRQK